jgi:hypothetical protein
MTQVIEGLSSKRVDPKTSIQPAAACPHGYQVSDAERSIPKNTHLNSIASQKVSR